MIIRSDKITAADIRVAFGQARMHDGQDIYEGSIRQFRPRKYRYGYELHAYATSGRRLNSGRYGAGDGYAATWDAYGYAMARLYRIDPGARVADYRSVADFCAVTLRYIPRGMTAGFRRLLAACKPW
jgi:hypothetical protein